MGARAVAAHLASCKPAKQLSMTGMRAQQLIVHTSRFVVVALAQAPRRHSLRRPPLRRLELQWTAPEKESVVKPNKRRSHRTGCPWGSSGCQSRRRRSGCRCARTGYERSAQTASLACAQPGIVAATLVGSGSSMAVRNARPGDGAGLAPWCRD